MSTTLLLILVACGPDRGLGGVGIDFDPSVVKFSNSKGLADVDSLAGSQVAGEVYLIASDEEKISQARLQLDEGLPVITVPVSDLLAFGPDARRSTVLGGGGYAWDTRTLRNGEYVGRLEVDYELEHGSETVAGDLSYEVRNVLPEATNRVLVGAWTKGGPWFGIEDTYLALESDLGYQLDIVHWYMSFDTRWSEELVARAAQDGRLPMITWETHVESLDDVAAGVYDGRVRAWARGAARYGEPIYLRPWQEMNADFFPWGMEPEAFVRAWRHLVDIFRSQGAYNVIWVWAPNATDDPMTDENRLENYYPGSGYVDVLALDGYNWGACRSWSRWETFDEVFTDAYARVAALGSQPIWVAEFGSTEEGGDKGAWLRDALTSDTFPRVEALVYFDENRADSCDWSIRSSQGSLQGFRDGLRSIQEGEN